MRNRQLILRGMGVGFSAVPEHSRGKNGLFRPYVVLTVHRGENRVFCPYVAVAAHSRGENRVFRPYVCYPSTILLDTIAI